MSSLRNIKKNVQAVRQNNGILLTDQLQLVSRAAAPTDANLVDGRIYYDSVATKAYLRAGTAWVDLTGGAVGGVTTWDAMYALDQNLNITGTYGTMTYTVTGNTAGLTLNKTGAGAGGVLVIANAGTGDDITGPDFSINGNGTFAVVELGTGATINATDGDLELSVSGSTTTIQGLLTCDEAATFGADIVGSDSSLTLTDSDEAPTVVITNDTAAAVNVVEIQADAIAAGGVLLHLDSLAAGMSTGLFLECYDGTNPAFTIGLYGATVIAGAETTDVFTITNGDMVLSDSSLTITDADNATTLSVTNNTAAAASLVEFAGSGTFTGTTTTSFFTITPSGLVAGTGVYAAFAALADGIGIHTYAAALTSGNLVYINQDGEALTSGELLTIDNTESGTLAAKTGNLCSISSSMTETAANRTEDYDTLLISRTDISNFAGITYTSTGSILKLSKTSTQTLGTLTDSVIGLEVLMPALCTGAGVSVIHAAPTGGCFVGANDATTTGIGGLSLTHTTAVITTGSVAKISSTSIDTGTGQGTLLDLVSSGATAAVIVKLTTAALTTGEALQIIANALTSGIGVNVESSATAITGAGRLAYFNHTGATTTAGTLVEIASAATDETIMFQLTASSTLMAGEIIKVTAASMTTGTVLEAISLDALTTGIGVHIESGATAITGAGRLLRIDHTGVTTTTAGIIAEIASAATDETIITKITATGALALGAMLHFAGSSVTTGDIIIAEALDALTTGIGIHLESGATAITGAGRLAYFNHTGVTTTSGTLVEVASAATDETILMSLTATGALTLGTALLITADSCTTGKGIDMTMDGLTTGTAVNVVSNSADITARILVNIHNDNTAAVGTVPLTIVQDALVSTNFKKVMTIAGNSIWVSDGTTPNAVLAATTGDICLNGTAGATFYCTNGAGSLWSTLA